MIQGVAGPDGGLAFRVGLLQKVGIAHLIIGVGIGPVLDDQVVGLSIAQVGRRGVAVQVACIGDPVVHGRVGPVAVEAQHGDGMDGRGLPFGGGHRLHIEIALQIGAVFVLPVQTGLHRLRQDNLCGDVDAAAGRDLNLPGFQGVQHAIGVIGGDAAVAVNICLGVDLRQQTGGVIQNPLGIVGVGIAVAV